MVNGRFVQIFQRHGQLVLYCVLWVGWGTLAYLASVEIVLPGDLSTMLWVQSFRSAQMDAVMKSASMLGDSISIIAEVAIIAGIFWLNGRRRHVLLILLIPTIVGVGDAFQWVIGRPRPSTVMLTQFTEPFGGSFPSGHVVWATSLTICLLLAIGLRQRSFLVIALWTLLFVFAFLTGLARIYLGAHWLSDVVGGYIFGALSAIGLHKLYTWWIEPGLTKLWSNYNYSRIGGSK